MNAIIIAIAIIGIGIWMWLQVLKAPYHDEQTNRLYRYVKDSENPNHAYCPRCNTPSKMIISIRTSNPKQHEKYNYGVDCKYCGLVWFDLG